MAEPGWIAFPSAEALVHALASGLVPAKTAAGSAQGGRTADGRVLVRPRARLPRDVRDTLAQAGIVETDAPPNEPRRAGTWPELVAPSRLAEPLPGPGPVLFVLPPNLPLAPLATELWRLGCDRQRFATVSTTGATSGDATLLLADDPPTLPLLRALDHEDGLVAYHPTPSNQRAVWTELGHVHPLADRIDAPEGLVLVAADGRWTSLATPTWTDLDATARLAAPTPTPLVAATRDLAFAVPIRLVRGPELDPPSLWVLAEEPLREVEALARALDEDALDHLLFAAARATDGTDVIVLRTRRAAAPLAIDVPGAAYVALRALPRLHVPDRRMIDPPLRPPTLARLFCPDAHQIAWLELAPDGAPRARTLDEAAFHPLSRWVDYVIDRDAPLLAAWIDQVRMDLAPFSILPDDAPSGDLAPRKPVRKRTTARARLLTAEAPPAPDAPPTPSPAPAPRPRYAPAPLPREPSALEARRVALEEEYLALSLAPDDSARAGQLVALARIYDALGEAGDASKCWARALWEEPAPEGVAGEWAKAELAHRGDPDAAVAAIASASRHSTEDLRAAAACVIATDAGEADPPLAAAVHARAHALQLTLERGDHALDARTRWLARAALARLARDPLLAARAKDHTLASLASGLVLDRDLPALLRRRVRPGGAPGAAGADRDRVVDFVDRLRESWRADDRRRFPQEVDPAITGAYLDFLFAYAMARVGQDQQARTMAQAASAVLPGDDAVHIVLAAMYQERVSQAIQGLPHHTPLPPGLVTRADALETYERYRVDRLREWSAILEPVRRVDAFVELCQRDPDRAPSELVVQAESLRQIEDPAALAPRLEAFALGGDRADADELALRATTALELAPRVGERAAVSLVERLVPTLVRLEPEARAPCVERALYVAGHFGDTALARSLLAGLRAELEATADAPYATLVPAVCAAVRVLRRLGLTAELAPLADHLALRAARHPHPVVAAQLAQALGYVGRTDTAHAVVASALDAIDAGIADLKVQRDLVRATALALHELGPERALPGLDRIAARLAVSSDHFMTRSHFSLVAINLVESIVFGLLGEELDLGDEGRRWLDTDELLVRRRIHTDAKHLAALAPLSPLRAPHRR